MGRMSLLAAAALLGWVLFLVGCWAWKVYKLFRTWMEEDSHTFFGG